MGIHHSGALAVAAVAVSVVTGRAGPCLVEIDLMQARVDSMIAATAAASPSAPESTAATMHRQPTPSSVAGAEAKLQEQGPHTERALAALAQARAADGAGDNDACKRALANAQGAIAPHEP